MRSCHVLPALVALAIFVVGASATRAITVDGQLDASELEV